MAKKKIKMVILGRIALLFGDRQENIRASLGDWPLSESIIYAGKTPVPRNVCLKIAPLHPSFNKYYEAAMAVLYRGCYSTVFYKGTEDPSLAVNSYALKRYDSKSESESYKHVLIWDPFK